MKHKITISRFLDTVKENDKGPIRFCMIFQFGYQIPHHQRHGFATLCGQCVFDIWDISMHILIYAVRRFYSEVLLVEEHTKRLYEILGGTENRKRLNNSTSACNVVEVKN